MRYFLAPILLGAVLFCFCSRQPSVTNMGSTNTGNAKLVSGTVCDAGGRLISDAQVVLRDIIITPGGDSIKSERTDITDASGHFSFADIPKGKYVVLARDVAVNNTGYETKCTVDSDTVEVRLTVWRPQVLKGRVLADSSVDKTGIVVAVAGMSNPVHPASDGFYTIDDVPRGQYDIGFIYGSVVNYLPVAVEGVSGDTAFVRDVRFLKTGTAKYSYYPYTLSAAWAVQAQAYPVSALPAWYTGKEFSYVRYFTVTASGLQEVNEDGIVTVLLEDFEDGNNYSLINAITGKSRWYVYTDVIDGGNSRIVPAVDTTFALGISANAAFSGNSFHATTYFGPADPRPFSSIACNVESKSKNSVDLSSMQSLSFFLKGRGQIRVAFWAHRTADAYARPDKWGQFGTLVQCPPVWTKIVIKKQDIILPAGSKQLTAGIKWQDAATNVYEIQFGTWETVLDTVDVWLDQIYINGVTDSIFR